MQISAAERRIRHRATAVVIRGSAVLLLREPGDVEFHLPGGGIYETEPASNAVTRELDEETGLMTVKANYLFDYCDFWGGDGGEYWGQVHNVFGVETSGDVALSEEHCEFIWWDGKSTLPLLEYVKPVLEMLEGVKKWHSKG